MQVSSLQQRIIELILQQGPIPFAEYMRMALYDPDQGYYVTGETRVGWEGDFFTSTDVSDLFAHCMGRQLLQMWKMLGEPTTFGILEQGSGRGDLARGVRAWAEYTATELATALDYRTADINAGLDVLQTHIEGFVPTVILSNELIDAFPVHVVEKHGGRLFEVYVTEQHGRLQETLGEPSNEAVSDYLDSFKVPWRTFDDGWRAEINLDAIQWMQRTSQLLLGPNARRKRRGFILAIDYGDTARELYTPDRYRGTLASYYKHQFTERPLARPGQQDITAHVNFTALLHTGRQQGLHLHSLTTQRQWLMNLGIFDELEQIHRQKFAIVDQERASDAGQIAMLQWYNLRQRVSTLIDPRGLGNFKVLILKR